MLLLPTSSSSMQRGAAELSSPRSDSSPMPLELRLMTQIGRPSAPASAVTWQKAGLQGSIHRSSLHTASRCGLNRWRSFAEQFQLQFVPYTRSGMGAALRKWLWYAVCTCSFWLCFRGFGVGCTEVWWFDTRYK